MSLSSPSSLRNLAVAVCFLIFASSAAALYSIHESGLSHSTSLKRFDEYKEAINSARVTQVAFKTQVQEWKNFLLRGQKGEDYQLYLDRFSENERRVKEELGILGGLMKQVELDPSEVEALRNEHNALGPVYRQALSGYRKDDPTTILTTDKAVRGIDRKLNEDIDALVHRIDAKGDKFLESFSAEAAEKEAFFRHLVLAFALATILVTFVFIFQALRISKAAR